MVNIIIYIIFLRGFLEPQIYVKQISAVGLWSIRINKYIFLLFLLPSFLDMFFALKKSETLVKSKREYSTNTRAV